MGIDQSYLSRYFQAPLTHLPSSSSGCSTLSFCCIGPSWRREAAREAVLAMTDRLPVYAVLRQDYLEKSQQGSHDDPRRARAIKLHRDILFQRSGRTDPSKQDASKLTCT